MNIFYLDKCPVKAAQVQYNKHVVKMILESAQMLCAAHHVLGSKLDIPYKIAHKNHPSTIWTRECAANYSCFVVTGTVFNIIKYSNSFNKFFVHNSAI